MRSKEQKIAVADRLLEAYRARQPGYRKTYRGHYAPRDEPDDDNNPEVRAHNAAVAKRLTKKKDARAELKRKMLFLKRVANRCLRTRVITLLQNKVGVNR